MPTVPVARLDTPPGLLALARERMRTRRLALRTEQAYLQWPERYVAFHHGRHPRTLGAPEVEQFLTHLAVQAPQRAPGCLAPLCARAQVP